jgi:misacylated tRNA(Ala) deacylase
VSTSEPDLPETDCLYLDDAYATSTEATVLAVDEEAGRICLDRTVFYPTGGGQPHDTGRIEHWQVVDVRSEQGAVWHTLAGADAVGLPAAGAGVEASIDWGRRYELMRTHTALHILCGVIWNEYGKAVTGGNMEPLAARMDFELDSMPEGFAAGIERRLNEEVAQDRSVRVGYLERSAAAVDPDLIRTKSNLVPAYVTRVRVIDIVGLDKQADGGTHVRATGEVGHVRVVKTESKGKGFKRVRIALGEGPLPLARQQAVEGR